MKTFFVVIPFVLLLFIPAPAYGFSHETTPSTTMNVLKEIDNLQKDPSKQIFRNVQVSGRNGKYTIQGEVKPHFNDFYYVVEDGHFIYIPEKKVVITSDIGEWSKFVIRARIDQDKLPKNGTIIMYLYEKGKGEKMKFVYPMVLEQFH